LQSLCSTILDFNFCCKFSLQKFVNLEFSKSNIFTLLKLTFLPFLFSICCVSTVKNRHQ
jgi:hypothetical protein